MNPHPENDRSAVQGLRDYWLWFVLLGVLITVIGFAAIGSAFIATLATVLVFGIMLIIAGIAQVINAFVARSWGAFFLHVLVGILYVVVGGIMVEHPLRSALIITWILAVAFLVGGIARIVFAAVHSFEGRAWMLLNGVITLLLGIAIWQGWPETAFWVIGLFIGIDLVFNGFSWMMLGFAVRPTSAPRDMASTPAAS